MIFSTEFPVVHNQTHLVDGHEALESTWRLYWKGQIPQSLEGQLLAVPMLRMLRAIYGKSNLGVAWCLLLHELRQQWELTWFRVRDRVGLLTAEERCARDMVVEEGEE